jgi:hypothetical protein
LIKEKDFSLKLFYDEYICKERSVSEGMDLEILVPACQSALQPWVSLGLLYNQSPLGAGFLNQIVFYRMGLLAPCPTPILEDQGVSLSLDSTL